MTGSSSRRARLFRSRPHHPLAKSPSIPPAALREQIWIHQPGCKITARFWKRHFAGLNPPQVSHRGRHTSHLQEMIAAGLGIMLAPEHMPCPSSVVARAIQGDSFSVAAWPESACAAVTDYGFARQLHSQDGSDVSKDRSGRTPIR